jgi:hypothetical protein
VSSAWRPSIRLQHRTWSDLSMYRTTISSKKSTNGSMVLVLISIGMSN